MRFHPILAFVALSLGSALGTLHGCSSSPAHADTGSGGSGGGACGPVSCVPPSPAIVTTYSDILTTLKAASRVRVVLDYSKCKLSGMPGPDALGSMNLDTFEWFGPKVLGNPRAFLAASENHLIRLSSGFVYDYVRVSVSDDEKVTVDVQYLDPVTFAVSVDETILCGISDGKTEKGATFYKMSP